MNSKNSRKILKIKLYYIKARKNIKTRSYLIKTNYAI